MNKIKNVMMEVKTYLQNVGIVYIDWKLDNMGISEDKQIKLFDFDASGLIDIETKQWIRRPALYWSYMQAINNGIENPIDIDNYAFDIEFNCKKI
jgi:serine/threonine protein kinase